MKFKMIILTMICLGMTSCSSSSPIEPVVHHNKNSKLPVWHPQYQTTFVEEYNSGTPEEDELEGVQCPIPMENRVRNYTGIQCVFSSTEMLARWAECKELLNPRITSRSNCQGYSGPSDLRRKLMSFGLKEYTANGSGPMFEDAYKDKNKAMSLLKKAMREKRGALFGVPGHAMVLIHYDEAADEVKWVDNSDRSLRVQTMSVNRFHQRWDGWICVIYADPDLLPNKAGGDIANQIPIVDRNNPQGEYDNYIPMPRR